MEAKNIHSSVILSNSEESRTNPSSFLRKFSGFTLVELIVVITILVILGTIGFLNIGGFSSSARDSRRVSDMANIGKAVDFAIITQGSAPVPSGAVTYTGGSVALQIGTVTNTTVPRMSGDFTDPVTKMPYNYSVFGNGNYYQIGIDFENPLSYSRSPLAPWERGWGWGLTEEGLGWGLIETAYADNAAAKYSKLSGNYRFDPSLPSLFVLSGTVNSASGGIFSPDVCFVMENNSNNTFSSGTGSCTKKKDIPLKNADSSLVGYWDMETVSGGLLKDLSGNGNDGTGSGGITIGGTGGLLWKGTMFSSGSQQFIRINESNALRKLGRNMTIDTLFYTKNIQVGRFLAMKFSSWTTRNYTYWNYISGWNGNWWVYTYFNTNLTVTWTARSAWTNYSYASNYHLLTSVYNGEKIKLYVDGKFLAETIIAPAEIIDSEWNFFIWEWAYYNDGANGTYYDGIIDDVKIYNRALSDEEIQQQAKIAGF